MTKVTVPEVLGQDHKSAPTPSRQATSPHTALQRGGLVVNQVQLPAFLRDRNAEPFQRLNNSNHGTIQHISGGQGPSTYVVTDK